MRKAGRLEAGYSVYRSLNSPSSARRIGLLETYGRTGQMPDRWVHDLTK